MCVWSEAVEHSTVDMDCLVLTVPVSVCIGCVCVCLLVLTVPVSVCIGVCVWRVFISCVVCLTRVFYVLVFTSLKIFPYCN